MNLSSTIKARLRKSIAPIAMLLISFFTMQVASAQAYTLQSYDMKVSGTSNVHDWTMKAVNAKCHAAFVLKTNSPLTIADLNALEFTVPVKGLKSESNLMDSRTHSTLKADKYTSIIFRLTNAEVIAGGNNRYNIKGTGTLTIAGVTKEIVIHTVGVLNADKSIIITGRQKIKMSDWQIKPPSFMLGAMKVGDEVSIDFNLKLN